jgi:hypothetical protein
MSTQQYISPAPSYPGLDRSWDDHYKRRRGRATSRDQSPSASPHARSGSGSRTHTRARPRSADARPQYNTMFYPPAPESRARRSFETPTGTYYPSQLPKADGIYHGDTMNSYKDQHRGGKSRPSIRQTRSAEQQPGDPYNYQNTINRGRMPSDNHRQHRQHLQPHQHQSQHSHSHLHPQHNNLGQSPPYSNKSDFLKDSLIMFGDEQDQTSESTGLSQQELLQKKRREQTTQRRKDKKKSSNKKNRLVNLPASLLNHSSRQPQQQPQPQHHQQSPLPPKPKSSQLRSGAFPTPTRQDYRQKARALSSNDKHKPEPTKTDEKQQLGWRSAMVRTRLVSRDHTRLLHGYLLYWLEADTFFFFLVSIGSTDEIPSIFHRTTMEHHSDLVSIEILRLSVSVSFAQQNAILSFGSLS